MELEIPESQSKKLKEIEKQDRKRIKKKLDEIEYKISDLNMDPETVIEKRLRGPLHGFLQQRIGSWRLWFEVDRENDRIILAYILRKKEAERMY